MDNKKEINRILTEQLICSGVGYCGMSEGVEIAGKLSDVSHERSHATITDKKGQPHAVNVRTVKIIQT